MDITLQSVTKDNWRLATKMKVKEGQENWVAPNWYSLLQTFYDGLHARLILNDEKPVGFLLYGQDEDSEKRVWIIRLMTDAEHQAKGYGRAALPIILDHLRTEYANPPSIYISFVPGNDIAKKLYEDIGFVDTGKIEDNELVFRYDFPPQS